MGIRHGTSFSRDPFGKKHGRFNQARFGSTFSTLEAMPTSGDLGPNETWDPLCLSKCISISMCVIYTYCERNKWKNQYL